MAATATDTRLYATLIRINHSNDPVIFNFIENSIEYARAQQYRVPERVKAYLFDPNKPLSEEELATEWRPAVLFDDVKDTIGKISFPVDERFPGGRNEKRPIVLLDTHVWDKMEIGERKALTGHELAHYYLDHLKKKSLFTPRWKNHLHELQADRLACTLCDDANPVVSMLVKVERHVLDNPTIGAAEEARAAVVGSRSHPSFSRRVESIAAYARDVMQKPLLPEVLEAARAMEKELRVVAKL